MKPCVHVYLFSLKMNILSWTKKGVKTAVNDPVRYNDKVDVPVDGKYLREALFLKKILHKNRNKNFASWYVARNTITYFK